jgi:plastocyanin
MTLSRAWSKRAFLSAVLVAGTLGSVSARAIGTSVASGEQSAPKPQTVTIAIDQATFTPGDVTVHVGDTVEWVNKDVFDHTSTGKHDEWRVELPAGKRGKVVMKKTGSFDYYCELHPNMTGHVVVKPASQP